MAKRDFGNEQDMPVADKQHPALGPTEGAQDVATLNRIIVPPGAYTDPNDPLAQSNSVNLTLDKTPTPVDEDYGKSSLEDAGVEADVVETPMDATALGTATPSDRDEWKKDDWKAQAAKYGLPTSGNMDELQERVEAYEADEQQS